MARQKSAEVERLRRAAAKARDERLVEEARRIQAEAVVHQQRLILEGLTEQIANATCGFAFAVGLLNPDAVVPTDDSQPQVARDVSRQ